MSSRKPVIKIVQSKIKLPDPNCWAQQFLTIPKKVRMDDDIFDEIWDLHPDEQMTSNLGTFHRYQASFGLDYNFSGLKNKARDINEHPLLVTLMEYVREHSEKEYNQLFINWYEDGTDYIGYHSDKGPLFPGASIYSFSYGQEREFYIRPNKKSVDPDFKLDLIMPHNSMIIMGGDMQKYYQHSVPKRSANKYPDRRINITMRLFKE